MWEPRHLTNLCGFTASYRDRELSNLTRTRTLTEFNFSAKRIMKYGTFFDVRHTMGALVNRMFEHTRVLVAGASLVPSLCKWRAGYSIHGQVQMVLGGGAPRNPHTHSSLGRICMDHVACWFIDCGRSLLSRLIFTSTFLSVSYFHPIFVLSFFLFF
jgi:hypothetical protein